MTSKSRQVMKGLTAVAAGCLAQAASAEGFVVASGDGRFPVTFLDNDAVKSLVAQMPLSLQFEDYGQTERIAYLAKKLDLGRAPQETTPAAGDICYYAPWGNIAVFLRPFRRSPGLVPLGRLSPEALEAVRTSGDAVLRLEAAP